MVNASLPTLSVVIPSHDRCRQLGQTVESLRRQHYPPEQIELIVVLDGCSDGSRRMLTELQQAGGPRLTVIEQPSSGPAVARNQGCAAARGDLIVFIDDDVVASPHLLLEHAKAYQADERVVVIGTMLPPRDVARPVWVRWEEQMLLRQYRAMLNGVYQATHRQFFTGNSSVARRWFEQSGGFNPAFRRAEDVELAWRLHRLGLTFAFVPQAEAYHYAFRTYQSWRTMHAAYGYADVVMELECGQAGRIALGRREFRARRRPIRWLCQALLNRRRVQQVADHLCLALARVCDGLRLRQPALMSLSIVANYRYWQGFNDALAGRPSVFFPGRRARSEQPPAPEGGAGAAVSRGA